MAEKVGFAPRLRRYHAAASPLHLHLWQRGKACLNPPLFCQTKKSQPGWDFLFGGEGGIRVPLRHGLLHRESFSFGPFAPIRLMLSELSARFITHPRALASAPRHGFESFPCQNKSTHKGCFYWRRRWDSNPRALSDNAISSRARYDHFDTSPVIRVCSAFRRPHAAKSIVAKAGLKCNRSLPG